MESLPQERVRPQGQGKKKTRKTLRKPEVLKIRRTKAHQRDKGKGGEKEREKGVGLHSVASPKEKREREKGKKEKRLSPLFLIRPGQGKRITAEIVQPGGKEKEKKKKKEPDEHLSERGKRKKRGTRRFRIPDSPTDKPRGRGQKREKGEKRKGARSPVSKQKRKRRRGKKMPARPGPAEKRGNVKRAPQEEGRKKRLFLLGKRKKGKRKGIFPRAHQIRRRE